MDEGGIDFEELAEIDLDLLDDVPDAQLRRHFLDLAMQATEGQLREVLEIPVAAPIRPVSDLADDYATRRTETALKLRGLRRT